jgi:Skp family chaperone for outer membrane proteins
MRRAALICAVAFAAQLTGAAAQTQTDAPLAVATPVLTIDQERLFAESQFGRAATERLTAEEAALVAENLKIETALEAEERGLTSQRPTMSADAFRVLADAFDVKVEGIRAAQRAKYTALTAAHDEDQRRFFVEIAAPVIAQTMQDMGAVAVLDKQSIILSLQSIDVTAEVIARIDATMGDGTSPQPVVPAPAPDANPPAPVPQVQP